MSAQQVYLSLGSNVGDRPGNLRSALDGLARCVRIEAVSPLYETRPVGVLDQPDFLNVAVAAQTDLQPHELLACVKGVERDVGRRPTFRWGPRVVDIDILLFGLETIDSPDLTIPHREMTGRAFVLVPLADIAPHALHPTLRRTVAELRDALAETQSVSLVGPLPD